MVIDTSALVAILLDEPERRRFNEAIEAAPWCRISTATLVEASIVFEARFGVDGIRDLDLFIAAAAVQSMPVDAEQVLAAREAFRCYGKGRHPAGLNFGDCFSYALASVLNEPLLFKGADFSKTDIMAAVPTH
jgi:ribonuclease VapC